MGIFGKVGKKLGFGDDGYDGVEGIENLDLEPEPEPEPIKRPEPAVRTAPASTTIGATNVMNLESIREQAHANNMKVMVVEPQTFDDTQQIANCIREKRPVIVNFENTDADVARRITDFPSGTTYALDGEIKKISRNVMLCAPQNVNIAYSQEKKTSFSEMPWINK